MRHLTAATALTILMALAMSSSQVSTTTAQPPAVTLEIETPSEIDAYKLIHCKAAREGKPCVWWVVGADSETVEAVQLGDGIVWTGPPGKYLVLVSCDGERARATVTVRPPQSPPTPGPAPARTLATKVAGLAQGLPEDQRKSVANNYATVAAQIAAGALKDIAAVNAATVAANRTSLSEVSDKWRTFFEALGGELEAMNASGKLKTLDDHAEAWRMISKGLGG